MAKYSLVLVLKINNRLVSLKVNQRLHTNPTFNYIGLPDELQEGRVVDEIIFSSDSRTVQSCQLVLQALDPLGNVVSIVISLEQLHLHMSY